MKRVHFFVQNFTLKDALLCQEFFFVKLLELYDWIECTCILILSKLSLMYT